MRLLFQGSAGGTVTARSEAIERAARALFPGEGEEMSLHELCERMDALRAALALPPSAPPSDATAIECWNCRKPFVLSDTPTCDECADAWEEQAKEHQKCKPLVHDGESNNHSESSPGEKLDARLRALGFEEVTPAQRAENFLVNTGQAPMTFGREQPFITTADAERARYALSGGVSSPAAEGPILNCVRCKNGVMNRTPNGAVVCANCGYVEPGP